MLACGKQQFIGYFMLLMLKNQLTAMRDWIDGLNGELDNVLDMLCTYLGQMQYFLIGSMKAMILQ